MEDKSEIESKYVYNVDLPRNSTNRRKFINTSFWFALGVITGQLKDVSDYIKGVKDIGGIVSPIFQGGKDFLIDKFGTQFFVKSTYKKHP